MTDRAPTPRRRVTNRQFAADIGVTESYASLIRAGKRLPGAAALVEMVVAFDLDANEVVRAYRRGPRALADFLSQTVPRVE